MFLRRRRPASLVTIKWHDICDPSQSYKFQTIEIYVCPKIFEIDMEKAKHFGPVNDGINFEDVCFEKRHETVRFWMRTW